MKELGGNLNPAGSSLIRVGPPETESSESLTGSKYTALIPAGAAPSQVARVYNIMMQLLVT